MRVKAGSKLAPPVETRHDSSTMSDPQFVAPDRIRSDFSRALSAMYRAEVPQYGTLLELVAEINSSVLQNDPELRSRLELTGQLDRISEERHGAIRLGTSAELSTMRRLFAIMGMYPVGYYDLSVAGIPVHSTAFRPVSESALNLNPFRVFTSLLRLDLIEDDALRAQAATTLARRDIFTEGARDLISRAESAGGLTEAEAERFVAEALETFRWHRQATVDQHVYEALHSAHRLIADVVCFRGPHINHLTPRTLDIDAVQAAMPGRGINPKAVVEGPPSRRVPILLRQTSFKALEEPVEFRSEKGETISGSHTARFGEIEQRGAALTPHGRERYDQMLAEVRKRVTPKADGSNAGDYMRALEEGFSAFPDDSHTLRTRRLAYFRYFLTPSGLERKQEDRLIGNRDAMMDNGWLEAEPITYEDFLPVSAAGIFQSNLGDNAQQAFSENPNRSVFEEALGCPVQNEFDLYQQIEDNSLRSCGVPLE